MSPEETFLKLDLAYQAHLNEQELIKQFTHALQKKAKDLISEHYPSEVNMLSAEGYRALENKIYKNASDLAVDVVNVFYKHLEED